VEAEEAMKSSISITLLCIFLVAGCKSADMTPAPSSAAAPAATAPSADSLYKRLGGYDAIAAVTDDFLARMISDKQLGRYFVGLSQSSRETLREHVIEFLCFEAKGPCLYVGRDLGEAHTGLNITESDWQVAVRHLTASLDKFHVPQREKNDLIGAIANFKEDIVGK
jgi:hemoglobin